LNNNKKISGFTLIELIVVISIVSILLLFSFPVFRDISLFSDSSSQVSDIARLINDLKNRAVEKNIDFFMHCDPQAGRIWVIDDTMGNEAREAAKENHAKLSENITFLDVEFPGVRDAGAQEYRIRFRKQGYSDFALIHIIEDEKNITLKIEPFLSKVQVLDKHIYLEDCN